jgi:hypothetical protein
MKPDVPALLPGGLIPIGGQAADLSVKQWEPLCRLCASVNASPVYFALLWSICVPSLLQMALDEEYETMVRLLSWIRAHSCSCSPLSPSHPLLSCSACRIWLSGPTPAATIVSSVRGIRGGSNTSYTPGSRSQSAGCVDDAGNLMLWTGFGDGTYAGDVWRLNPTTLVNTWLAGAISANSLPNYSAGQGTALSGSTVAFGGRLSPSGWWSQGAFWMFGGQKSDGVNTAHDLSERVATF